MDGETAIPAKPTQPTRRPDMYLVGTCTEQAQRNSKSARCD
jgi:hypothetical protein